MESLTMLCVLLSWSPKIGDPHLVGWFTVLAYALTALAASILVVRADRYFGSSTIKAQRTFWLGIAILYAFLAVNKELDLQSFITATGRCIAQLDG